MARCEECGRTVMLAYTCHYCGKRLCGDHRLPETHGCEGLRASETGVRRALSPHALRPEEEFRVWLESMSTASLVIAGHRFEKTASREILVDNGRFQRDEALAIVKMLVSRNPFARLDANVVILGRNGTLYTLLLLIALVLMAIVVIRVAR